MRLPVRAIADLVRSMFGLVVATLKLLLFTPAIASGTGETPKELNLPRDKLDRLTRVDPVTGLLSRGGFDEACMNALDSPRTSGHPVAVIVCGLDGFDVLKDRLGDEYGDTALRYIAKTIRSAIGDKSIVLGRHGSEKFVLLLVDVTRVDALAFAEGLRRTIAARPVDWKGDYVAITISVGTASTAAYEGQSSPLIAQADAALFDAGRLGRNRVVEWSESPLSQPGDSKGWLDWETLHDLRWITKRARP